MVKRRPQLDPKQEAKKFRLLFATTCVAAVLPGVREEQMPKREIFKKAAAIGVRRPECPLRFRNNAPALQIFLRNKWRKIRISLPEMFPDVLPVYVNGATFGGGGGYRRGDLKHARKQLERDKKIADGVVNAANDYAEASRLVFPQIEATQTTLVSRAIAKKR